MTWNKLVVILVFLTQYYYLVFSFPNKFNNQKVIYNQIDSDVDKSAMVSLLNVENNQNVVEKVEKVGSKRDKRQSGSGAGKFTEASQMSQMKVFQVYLQLFKNLWASSYVGGSHPMHLDVPKPVIYLFKDNIVHKFFPDVGEERQKKSH